MVAEVIINSKAKQLNRTFDYNIPKEMEELILIGSKVLVPLENENTRRSTCSQNKRKITIWNKRHSKSRKWANKQANRTSKLDGKKILLHYIRLYQVNANTRNKCKDVNKRIQDKK